MVKPEQSNDKENFWEKNKIKDVIQIFKNIWQRNVYEHLKIVDKNGGMFTVQLVLVANFNPGNPTQIWIIQIVQKICSQESRLLNSKYFGNFILKGPGKEQRNVFYKIIKNIRLLMETVSCFSNLLSQVLNNGLLKDNERKKRRLWNRILCE